MTTLTLLWMLAHTLFPVFKSLALITSVMHMQTHVMFHCYAVVTLYAFAYYE